MTDALNIDALGLQIATAFTDAAEARGMIVAWRVSHSDSSYLTVDGVTVRISSHRSWSNAERPDISIIVRPPDGHPFGGCDANDDIWLSQCIHEQVEILIEGEDEDGEALTIHEIDHRRVYWMPDQDELVADLVARVAARAANLESEDDD